jgi:MFS family permease
MLTADHIMPKDRVNENKGTLSAWVVCFSAALFFFYEFIQMNLFNAISPQLLATFSLNAEQLGRLSAFYFYANLLFLFPAGLILDRFSTRKVILSSMLICVTGTYLFAMSTDLQWASLFRFLTGIGSAFCFLSCVRLASRWFPARRMALVIGLIVTMAMLGGFVAQTPMTKLALAFGWRHALMIDAGLGVGIIAIIWLFVRDYPTQGHFQQHEAKAQLQAFGFFKSMRYSYLNLQNWLCGIYTCLMNLPVAVLGALWGSLYLEQVYQLTPTEASFITSMIFIGTMIGSPTAGWVSDKIGLRRVPMILGSLLTFSTIAFIMYNPFHSVLLLEFLFFALGFFSSSQVISYPTVGESNSRLITASSVSVVSFTTISGYAIAQPLFGKLMDLHWNNLIINHEPIYSAANFHLALMLLPIGFFTALIAALLMRETYCKPAEDGVDAAQ